MARTKKYDENEVLEKAMNLFWEKGYEGTSVRDLEKEMGINQFSIYSSFLSKKHLFIQSLKKYKTYVTDNHFNILLQENTKLNDLKKILYGFVDTVKDEKNNKGCLVVNTTGEIGLRDKEIADELKSYYAFVKKSVKNILDHAKKNGEISVDTNTDELSNFLLGVMQGLSISAKILSENQIKDIVNVALNSIK